MISLRGGVSDTRQPIVSVTTRGENGLERTIDALLDTGFNGTLTLPPQMVVELELEFWFNRTIMLADGTLQDVNNYRGRVLWEGIERPIRVLATGAQPLIGMVLLMGCRLCIDAIDGGEVTVVSL